MNINDNFPSKCLKASDLKGKRLAVVIDRVEVEKIGTDKKPVVYFEGKEKGLVLNKTNSNKITQIAGSPETDDWQGVKIVLFSDMVDYQGNSVPAIRVDWHPEAKKAQLVEDDDEIPF